MSNTEHVESFHSTPANLTNIVDLHHEETLLACLRRIADDTRIMFAPNIPAHENNAAGLAVDLPEDEEALIVVDYTLLGSTKECMVIGRNGIYNRWNATADPKSINFAEYLKADISYGGGLISIGDDLKFSSGAVSVGPLLELLRALQNALREGVSSETAGNLTKKLPGQRSWYFDWKGGLLGFGLASVYLYVALARSMQSGPKHPEIILLAFVGAVFFFGIKKRKL